MRRTVAILSLAALLSAAGATEAETTTPPSAKAKSPAKPAPPPKEEPTAPSGPKVEFPASDAGRRAQAWFEAFNQGEAAMKKYLATHVAPAGLKRRSLEDRLEVYRDIREERGKVTPLEIEEFTEARVKAIARGERGGRFAITFLCEEEPPHGLMGLQIEDLPPEEGTPEGLDDAEYSQAPPGPPMSDARVASSLRGYVDSLARAGSFSGAVLLAKGDRVLVRRAYGLASRRHGTPNRPDTKFNLGSINKAFTRLAIEQLAAKGALGLDDPIDRYLPDYPNGAKITVRMLLDHRGGVPDIFGARYRTADRTSLRTVADFVELIRDQPPRFEPGTRQEYSNGGYVLLGAIVEKASGTDYYDYVRKHVFEPAGMKSTDSYELDDPVANLASGYTRRLDEGKSWRDAVTVLPGRGSPAGGGYSTVDDLLRFARALRSGALGKGGAQAEGIAGGSPGTNSLLLMQGEWTLVVLSNLDPPAAERVGTKAGSWLRRAGAPGSLRRAEAPGARERAGAPATPDRSRGPGSRPESTRLPDAGATVPMAWAGHLASVEVMLNGQGPFRFAIDTGAAGCARIDAEVARRLALPVIGEARVGDPSGQNAKTAPIVRLDSLSIGGATFTGLAITSGDYAGRLPGERVDGILGYGLFAECLWTLDFPGQRMTIARGEVAANDPDAVGYHDERGIPAVTLRVAGVDVDADVDAGAMGGLSLPDALAEKLPLAEPPRVVGRARTVSNEFEIRAARLDGDATLGGVTFPRPMVEFQPLFPMANVGSRVLREFVVTFDSKNRRMRLARSA